MVSDKDFAGLAGGECAYSTNVKRYVVLCLLHPHTKIYSFLFCKPYIMDYFLYSPVLGTKLILYSILYSLLYFLNFNTSIHFLTRCINCYSVIHYLTIFSLGQFSMYLSMSVCLLVYVFVPSICDRNQES